MGTLGATKLGQRVREDSMAEGGGLEPPRPKPPVFKTGALPITLTLRRKMIVCRGRSVARRSGQFPLPPKLRGRTRGAGRPSLGMVALV